MTVYFFPSFFLTHLPELTLDLVSDVHAILGWFDVSFRACHKSVSFSTGPHAKYTHWKRESDPLRFPIRP